MAGDADKDAAKATKLEEAEAAKAKAAAKRAAIKEQRERKEAKEKAADALLSPEEKAKKDEAKKAQKKMARKVGLGVAAGVAKTSARRIIKGGKGEAGGVVGRTAVDRQEELTALAGRIGAGQAKHRAKLMFASAERKEKLNEEQSIKTAEQVRDALGGMKGVVMKIAQMESFTNENMSGAWKDNLSQLQSAAPPMSAELAAEVVEKALGAPPEQLFAEWDPVPIGSASIGQVHRAITHDDLAVAVKVQYPAAADALTGDLDNLDSLIQMVFKMVGEEQGETMRDAKPVIEEFRIRISEEVDYESEARNQQRFADYFAGHPFLHVPTVVRELSGPTVLTTELVDGVKFAATEDWSQEERDLAGEAIFRFVQHSIFRLGAYNGDPHPGNYLFHPGGRVTFLDFGLVKTVEPTTTALLSSVFATAVTEADPAAFDVAMRAAGFVKPGATIDQQLLFDRYGTRWSRFLADEVSKMPFPKRGGPKRPVDEHGLEIPKTDEEEAIDKTFEGAVRLPPEFTMLMRLLDGMQAIVARLGSEQHWRAVASQIWPFTATEPVTDLGRLEADWIAGKR